MGELRDYVQRRLATAFERSGLTQELLARRAGVDVRTVRRVLHGDTCSLDTVQAVARVLRVDWGTA